ncbi:MAG: sensor histidine kinase [Reyranellaceae bacterium]
MSVRPSPTAAGKPRFGLSLKLLLLSVAFVMLASALIFVPSIGNFRTAWLTQRLANAHLATLTLDVTPDAMVSEELAMMLLDLAEVRGIALKKGGGPRRVLALAMPPKVDLVADLESEMAPRMIGGAFESLFSTGNRVIRVMGRSPADAEVHIEVLVDEAPLRAAMVSYGRQVLLYSFLISLITAALLYLTLRWLMVRPLQRLSGDIMAFRRDPETPRPAHANGRGDEIGVVERELADMQAALQAALQQKDKLATLGTAVTKINHDLRNILATAQLLSDYLESSDDPKVRKVAPTMMRAIDRAVALCTDTLNFTAEAPRPDAGTVELPPLIAEVETALSPAGNGEGRPAVDWQVGLAPGFCVRADRELLFRVVLNIARNAVQAGATRIAIAARRAPPAATAIEIADNGPGLPPRARENLFRPFAGNARPGGTGLGLAIARDLMRAQGGELALVDTGGAGTVFRLTLPDAEGGKA